MKKLLLLVVLFPAILFSQSYIPFISTSDSSDTWMDVNGCTNGSCYYSSTKRYTINGDTTIGLNTYAKLFVKEKYELGSDQGQWCPEGVSYYEYYFGAIRESGKKVFVVPAASSEYLAYDFNLTVGDTAPSPKNTPGNELFRVIWSIDSVLVYGVYRKRYNINPPYTIIIEGIGSSTGLFNDITYIDDCYSEIYCYAEYGVPGYFEVDCAMNLGLEINDPIAENKTLMKIVDLLGRETEDKSNTILIYIYSDGTIKKVFRVELI